VLASCDAVVAEDTRHSGNLLKHLGIQKALHSLPAFDEIARVEPLVHRLVNGESLALVTDSGTPAVSDPGSVLVRRAVEEGVAVVPCRGRAPPSRRSAQAAFPKDGSTSPVSCPGKPPTARRCWRRCARCVPSSSSTNRRSALRRRSRICARSSAIVRRWSPAS